MSDDTLAIYAWTLDGFPQTVPEYRMSSQFCIRWTVSCKSISSWRVRPHNITV